MMLGTTNIKLKYVLGVKLAFSYLYSDICVKSYIRSYLRK